MFKPDISISEQSQTKPTKRMKGGNEVKEHKGVQQHLDRIMEAKKKKIEEARAFLLPSQKKMLMNKSKNLKITENMLSL